VKFSQETDFHVQNERGWEGETQASNEEKWPMVEKNSSTVSFEGRRYNGNGSTPWKRDSENIKNCVQKDAGLWEYSPRLGNITFRERTPALFRGTRLWYCSETERVQTTTDLPTGLQHGTRYSWLWLLCKQVTFGGQLWKQIYIKTLEKNVKTAWKKVEDRDKKRGTPRLLHA
jgi:hypothetical protein